VGIDEDPVTGSAQCAAAPYWAGRLGKAELDARQLSARGGALRSRVEPDAVTVAGRCVLYLEGTIVVPGRAGQ
jgi:predicted PhzF superfamily epimerase YddE/YHI9